MCAGRASGQLCGRRAEYAEALTGREAERAFAREHRSTRRATKSGEGYPPANSSHGQDEVCSIPIKGSKSCINLRYNAKSPVLLGFSRVQGLK